MTENDDDDDHLRQNGSSQFCLGVREFRENETSFFGYVQMILVLYFLFVLLDKSWCCLINT